VHRGSAAKAGVAAELLLHALERLSQRLAVADDGVLRLARRVEATEVVEDDAAARACLLVLLVEGDQALAHLRVARAGESHLRIAVEQALGDLVERVEVLAEQD